MREDAILMHFPERKEKVENLGVLIFLNRDGGARN